jgi:hypothetical protein
LLIRVLLQAKPKRGFDRGERAVSEETWTSGCRAEPNGGVGGVGRRAKTHRQDPPRPAKTTGDVRYK